MSSHPNPGNRTQYINQEAALLTVASAADVSEFEPIQAAFASLPPAGSTSDIEREKPEPRPETAAPSETPGKPGPPPPP
jgi:hypothetical protein